MGVCFQKFKNKFGKKKRYWNTKTHASTPLITNTIKASFELSLNVFLEFACFITLIHMHGFHKYMYCYFTCVKIIEMLLCYIYSLATCFFNIVLSFIPVHTFSCSSFISSICMSSYLVNRHSFRVPSTDI